jgi:hypothetical protein
MRISLSIACSALLAFACASTSSQAHNPPQGWNNGGNAAQPIAGQVDTSRSPTAQVAHSTSDNNTGVHVVTGPVREVTNDGISLGALTLKVDRDTTILRDGMPVSEGLSAIHEGQQVRASFDAGQKHASRIELLSGNGMTQGVNGTQPHAQPPAPPTDATTTPQTPPGR